MKFFFGMFEGDLSAIQLSLLLLKEIATRKYEDVVTLVTPHL